MRISPTDARVSLGFSNNIASNQMLASADCKLHNYSKAKDLLGLVRCPNYYNNRIPAPKIPNDIIFTVFNCISRKNDSQALAPTDTLKILCF